MKILIISSCTGEKAIKHERQLNLDDFQSGWNVVESREKELTSILRTAELLYTGEQHSRLMKGINEIREDKKIDLTFYILSAGYGLINSERRIIPYEATFSTMKKRELRNWSDQLNIPSQFKDVISVKYDLGLILLGEKYLDACQLTSNIKFGGPTILFCSPSVAKKLPQSENLKSIPLYNQEAKRMRCGLIGLKGEVARRILNKISKEGNLFINKLMTEPTLDLLGN